MPRKELILVTNPNAGVVCLLNLFENVQSLSVIHVMSGNNIEHLIDRLYFTDNIVVVTDGTSIDLNSGDVKVIEIEENARKSLGYHLNGNVNFPFGLLNRSESLLL